MADSLSSDRPMQGEIGTLHWPPYPDAPVEHVNAFSFALNDSTDECEIALGRVRLPVGTGGEAETGGLDVHVVVRIVMSQRVLRELSRGVAEAARVAAEGPTE